MTADAALGNAVAPESIESDGLFAGFDPETYAEIGVPVAAVFRTINQLRGLLENEDAGVPPALVDAAFLQAHLLGVADIIAHAHTDEEQDEQLIAGFTAGLRETVAIARIL